MNRQCLSEFHNKQERSFSILSNCVFVLLGIFIFCIPFPYTTAITNISFYGAILIALILLVFKYIKLIIKTPLTYPFLIFFIWSCLSLVWALNFENSVSDVRGHMINYLILFFLIINFFNSKKRFNILAWIVVLSAVVFSIIGMVYYYIIMDNAFFAVRLGHILPNNINASTELPVNMIGTLTITALMLCLFFFFREVNFWKKIAIAGCAVIIVAATVLTQSRGAIIALVTVTIIILFMKNKKLIPVFLIGLSLIVIISPWKKDRMEIKSFVERLKINYITINVIKDHPLLGIGFGMKTFSDDPNIKDYAKHKVSAQYKPEDIYSPHNWLLDITVRLGLIGLALFMGIIFTFLRMCRQIIKYAKDDTIRQGGIYVTVAFISYFIIGLMEPVFLFSASAIIFYVILAMITILWLLNKSASDKL